MQECDSDKLVTPDNAVMEGTGTIPGTSRKFSCKPGYVLDGVRERLV